MYVPAHFSEDDPMFVSAFLAEHPLGQLVTLTTAGLVATPLPMLHEPAADGDGWGSLVGHVARANRQWRDSDPSVPALAIFSGPDGYVSPSWYPSKREHGKVVPTWNYESVHLTGDLVVHDDPAWTRALVTRLTERHESPRSMPWAVSDAPGEYIDSMLRAVVGIEVRITAVQAKRKLSQNRSAEDVEGVIAGLDQTRPSAQDLAESMRRAAPRANDG